MTNKNFLFVAAFFFTSILFAQKRLYIHSSGKELALVDADGNLKTKTDFDEIEDFGADDWTNTKAFLMKKGDNFGLINYQGEWIFPLKYSGISCRNGLCNLSEKGKSGFGNEKEEILVPLEYEELGFINEDKIKAQKEGKWGYINVKNEWIIAPQFDSEKLDVYDFSEDLAKIV